mgnify:CR=1 FL=1
MADIHTKTQHQPRENILDDAFQNTFTCVVRDKVFTSDFNHLTTPRIAKNATRTTINPKNIPQASKTTALVRCLNQFSIRLISAKTHQCQTNQPADQEINHHSNAHDASSFKNVIQCVCVWFCLCFMLTCPISGSTLVRARISFTGI